MENPMKNFFRTIIVYSSLLMNDVIFYLSSCTRETSEIIASLIFKTKPKLSFEELKNNLLLGTNYANFHLLSTFPYLNCFNLISLNRYLMENNADLSEIADWNNGEFELLINRVYGNNLSEMTVRCLNYLLKCGKILKMNK